MRTRPSEVAHIENTRMKLRSSSPKLFAFGSIEHDMAHNFSMEMLRSTHLNENWIERGEFAALKKIRRYSLSIVNCDHGRIVATGGYEEAQTIKVNPVCPFNEKSFLNFSSLFLSLLHPASDSDRFEIW